MRREYTLEWLDALITVSLDPEKTDFNAILPEQITYLKSRIEEEKNAHRSFLNNKVFGLLEEKKINILINRYHSSLIVLLDQAFENRKKIPPKQPALKQLADELTTCLDELLSFIETRFSNYLSLDERVPATCLSEVKNGLGQRTDKLKTKLLPRVTDDLVMAIVFNNLYSFIDPSKSGCPVTFKAVSYIKGLLEGLEALEGREKGHTYSALDELLIGLNFNCKEYMDCITENIAQRTDVCESLSEKMDCLLLHFKALNQLHHQSGIALRPDQTSLKDELSNWFMQEISYLEKSLQLSLVPFQGKTEPQKQKRPVEKEKTKVLCALSTDQTGLILRAADESRVLQARSMSQVFKTIVPYLSTPYKENLSPDSMRSKSYIAEERDKKTAIETLEKVIEKIRGY